MTAPAKRLTAVYARVSTAEQKTLRPQVRQLIEFCSRRDWTVTHCVKDIASGAAKRDARDKIMAAARRGEIHNVVVWKLDRWGRSVVDLLRTLHELAELDVRFISLTEAIDLGTAAGRALVGMLGVFAEFERDLIRERVRFGIARARKEGRRLGRPPSARQWKIQIRRARAKGLSAVTIAKTVGISVRSVHRVLQESR